MYRALVIRSGAIAEAALVTFAQGFFRRMGQHIADGVYQHDGASVQVLSNLPRQIPPQAYVVWCASNGVWWMQSQYGRWYWSAAGWYPG